MADIDKDSGLGGETLNWSPYSRPKDVDDQKLEEARKVGLKQLEGLPTTHDYLTDSQFMPPWTCQGCSTPDIPCAQAECPHCGQERPHAYRDPEQGEETPDGQIGGYRKKARGEQISLDLFEDPE